MLHICTATLKDIPELKALIMSVNKKTVHIMKRKAGHYYPTLPEN